MYNKVFLINHFGRICMVVLNNEVDDERVGSDCGKWVTRPQVIKCAFTAVR